MFLDKSGTLYSIHILFSYIRILLFLTELLQTSESWKEMCVPIALPAPQLVSPEPKQDTAQDKFKNSVVKTAEAA